MGKIDTWDPFLKTISERNYNMVHFTPLQRRGASNSPYSIYDQLDFSLDLFDQGKVTDTKSRVATMSDLVERMEQDYNLLSMTDVVWNHTAHNSDWLMDHPEAAYNLHNSPHLQSAYELDSALLDFSSSLKQLGLPIRLSGKSDLLKIMEALKTHVLGAIRLWEFYVVDVKKDVQESMTCWEGGQGSKSFENIELKALSMHEKGQKLAEIGIKNKGEMGGRFHCFLDPIEGAGFLNALFGDYQNQHAEGESELKHLLNDINLPLYQQYDDDSKEILEQVYNRTQYNRLDPHGPQLGDITER